MSVRILPVTGLGEVRAGDDLGEMIAGLADLRDGDVVVVSSKVVSKAEGRVVRPADGETVEAARRRLAIRDEVLVETPHVVVVRTANGHVCANAGIDASNVPGGGVLLLPDDPDRAAAELRTSLARRAGVDVAVIVADTFGRAWREGQTDVALGVAGMAALRDERGNTDREGHTLQVTLIAVADQLAGAADLVRDKAAGVPVVVIRGLDVVGHVDGGGAALVRPPATDLFPHGRGWLARRLATGQGQPVREGPPTDWERDLVEAAVGTPIGQGAERDGTLIWRYDNGLAAGRAEACLLDLGYDAVAASDGAGWVVRIAPSPRSSKGH